MYEKLCIIYQVIVNEIFKGVDAVSKSSDKTPAEVVKFQNLHQMNRMCNWFLFFSIEILIVQILFLFVQKTL
jgi:hypothetical protein